MFFSCFNSQVAIIFTCTRLAQDSVHGYLPLFLTEGLLFPKVYFSLKCSVVFKLIDNYNNIIIFFSVNQAATAYFPLVLLTSGSVASSACNKLKRKIGSKVRPRLTAFSSWSFHVCDGGNALIAPVLGLSTWWWWSAERGNKSTIILMALFNLTRRMNHLFSSYDSQEFDSLRDSRIFSMSLACYRTKYNFIC